jgi:hypothetical protein
MIGATLEQAMAANRVQSDGVASATDFIGRRQIDCDDPQAFLVRAGAGHVIPGHFHAVDQFQIFVEGSAKLGRFDLHPGSVHYTDAYTTYGPIIATEEGYGYFTLRPVSTTSYHKMPGEAKLLKEVRHSSASQRRMLMGEVDEAPEAQAGIAPIFTQPDGVGAYRLTAGPGEALAFPEEASHGRFLLVVGGSATAAGQVYGLKSCLWADDGEAFGPVIAGDDGVVAVLAAFGKQAG